MVSKSALRLHHGLNLFSNYPSLLGTINSNIMHMCQIWMFDVTKTSSIRLRLVNIELESVEDV